jgi:hypothetical protein
MDGAAATQLAHGVAHEVCGAAAGEQDTSSRLARQFQALLREATSAGSQPDEVRTLAAGGHPTPSSP